MTYFPIWILFSRINKYNKTKNTKPPSDIKDKVINNECVSDKLKSNINEQKINNI
jgi:hypothetical protein